VRARTCFGVARPVVARKPRRRCNPLIASQDFRVTESRQLEPRLAFSVAEYQRRAAAAKAATADRTLDAFLSTSLGNICYLTGFQTIASYGFALYATLVQPDRDVVLLSSDFESHNAAIDSWVERVVTYEVMADPVESLIALLVSAGLEEGRVGIETGYGALTVAQADELRRRLPRVQWVEASGMIEALRAVKSEEELQAMRQAARISSAGMAAAVAAVSPGATDNDVAAAAAGAVLREGGEHFSIVPIVTAGRRSGIPHTSFRRYRLEPGDPVFIEVCASYQRYAAPILRTVSVGEPSAPIRRAFDACLASVETLLREVRAGVQAREVAARAGAAMRAIEPALIWHGYFGGSTGLSFSPSYSDGGAAEISDRSATVLQAGMTFHASTSLRRLGEFGVTVSETIAVTETGCEVLTQVPRQLFVA
jgi:Xaa-Pro dipeptidase